MLLALSAHVVHNPHHEVFRSKLDIRTATSLVVELGGVVRYYQILTSGQIKIPREMKCNTHMHPDHGDQTRRC
jgi:hypothetical protein